MDVLCPRCAEPWDNDSIHEEVDARRSVGETATYATVAAEFRSRGCVAFREFAGITEECTRSRSEAAAVADALYDLLGDDMDGAATMLADFGY